jgi:hypothetical protein
MTLALKRFLADHPGIETIEQKYSEPGHGNVQEVDAVHSVIERHTKNMEMYSPISLVRALLSVPKGKTHLQIIQLHKRDFFNYKSGTAGMNFALIPYTRVKHLLYKRDHPMKVHYRLLFSDVRMQVARLVRVTPKRSAKKGVAAQVNELPNIMPLNATAVVDEGKKKDIMSMMKYFPDVDQDFYKTLFK